MFAFRSSLSPLPLLRCDQARAVVTAVVLAVSVSGCATSQLGAPPSPTDLENEGGGAEQDQLFRRYEVAFDGAGYFRPGAPKETIAGLSVTPRAAPESDSARNYLTTSEKAAEIYDGPLLWTHRVLGTGMPYLVADGVILGTGTVVGAATGAAVGASSGNPEQIVSGAVCGGLVGGVFALMTAGACVGVGYKVVRPVIGILAQSDYRRAAEAFNTDLRAKIQDSTPQAGGGREQQAPPSALPPPQPDTALETDGEDVAPPPPEELDLGDGLRF